MIVLRWYENSRKQRSVDEIKIIFLIYALSRIVLGKKFTAYIIYYLYVNEYIQISVTFETLSVRITSTFNFKRLLEKI